MFQTVYFLKVKNLADKFQRHWWNRLLVGQEVIEGLLGLVAAHFEVCEVARKERLEKERLKVALCKLIQPIQEKGDSEDWCNAAETQRTYTWVQFQELDVLLKEIK